MPKRFDAYRMRDGATALSEGFFNPVFSDIDNRIADLEERRAELQAITDEIAKFGLQRIDVLTARAMADMNAILTELRQVRDELTAGTQLAAAIGAEQAARTEAINEAVETEALERTLAMAQEALARSNAIAAEAAARTAAIAQEATTRAAAVAGEATARSNAIQAESTARTAAIAAESAARASALAQVTAKPSAATFSYDASGRVSGTVETLPTGERATTLTYGTGGRVSIVAETLGDVTRTTTYNYDGSGRVGGFNVAGG